LGMPFFCINTLMGSKENKNKKMFNISPHIIMSVGDNNIGNMYVYDNNLDAYVLNGATASQLVVQFVHQGQDRLSDEILDTIMNMNNQGVTN